MAKIKESHASHTNGKESEAKLAITAARDLSAIRYGRCAGGVGLSSLSESSSILANRRAAQQLLASSMCNAGAEDRFEKIRAQNQIDMRHFAEAKKAEAVKCAAAGQHALLQGIDSRRKAVGVLAESSDPFYVTLEKPFLIWATRPSMLGDTHVEPWNSWAKFKFHAANTSGWETITFYYLWENPSDRFAVVNIDGYIILNGFCKVGQNGGYIAGDRSGSIRLTTELFPLEWWNQPPTSPLQQTDQTADALTLRTLHAAAYFDDGETETASVFRGYDLRHTLFLLPPHGVTVIEVALQVAYGAGSDGGHVDLDFESGDFKIMSPFVLIAVLT